MKTIINLLIIPFLLLTLSSANAQTQTMWSRIEKQTNINDVTLPVISDNWVKYSKGVGQNASITTADCIALKFDITSTKLSSIKSNPNVFYDLFSFQHDPRNSEAFSVFQLQLRYQSSSSNYKFRIVRQNHFLDGRKLGFLFLYNIEDLLIPSASTTTQNMHLLLSDCGAVLWQNVSSTGEPLRTAPLFFGYPSNGYHSAGTIQYGIIDYLRYNTDTTYDLNIRNYGVTNFVLRKPKQSFKTLSQMIFENSNTTSNPIRNQRLSGESSSSEETLSIDDSVLFSSSIKLHPNPSNGQFNIDLPMTEPGNVSFEIFNMNGQKVFEQKQVEFFQGSTTHHLDTQNKLTSGVYFLNVTGPNFSQKTKLIIK
jgi:hypothetical protein